MQRRGIRDVFVVVWSHSRQSTEGIMCPCISLLSRHAQEGGMSCSFEPSHLAQTTSHFLRSGSWGPCAHDKVSRVPSASAWKCRGANLVFQLAIGVGFAAACGESCHCVAGLAIPSPCYIRPSFRYFLQCTVCLCVLVHRLRGFVTCRVSKFCLSPRVGLFDLVILTGAWISWTRGCDCVSLGPCFVGRLLPVFLFPRVDFPVRISSHQRTQTLGW